MLVCTSQMAGWKRQQNWREGLEEGDNPDQGIFKQDIGVEELNWFDESKEIQVSNDNVRQLKRQFNNLEQSNWCGDQGE
jgi:hypothetical protein